jgi:hypothetical protein
MTALVMVFVVLAALLPVAAGVWVAVALIAAIRENSSSPLSAPNPPAGNDAE